MDVANIIDKVKSCISFHLKIFNKEKFACF